MAKTEPTKTTDRKSAAPAPAARGADRPRQHAALTGGIGMITGGVFNGAIIDNSTGPIHTGSGNQYNYGK